MLCAQQRRTDSGCRRTHRKNRQQLFEHQLQLRPHAAVLDERQGAGNLSGNPGGGPRERPAILGTRFGAGPVLQPHDHAARQRARQTDASDLGHRRFSLPLRPGSGRYVAARNGRGSGNARPDGAARHPVHHSRALAGQVRRWRRRHRTARGPGARLPAETPVGPLHQSVFLRRPGVAGGCV